MRLNPIRTASKASTAPGSSRPASLVAAALLALLLVLASCSEDGPLPVCFRCEDWRQLTVGLARFADPHPTMSNVFVFSTIQKDETASDSQRETDEDIWLLRILDWDDPSRNEVFQVTGDEMGTTGDNFAARWSPDGTQIVFVHSSASGGMEVWRVGVDAAAFADSGGPAIIGTPEQIASSGRDPEWISDTEILFTDGDKLFRSAVSPLPGGRGGGAVQLSFGPPIFASAEKYLDRHPDVEDGLAVFNTTGRQPVGDIFVEAVESDSFDIDPSAFLLLRATGTVGAYPLFEGADTLRTPTLLRSLPLDGGGRYVVGAKLDQAFYPVPDSGEVGRVTYCDTMLTAIVDLESGKTDSVRFRFQHARGTLKVRSAVPITLVNWSTDDGVVELSSRDFGGEPPLGTILLENPSRVAQFDCLPSHLAEPDENFGHVFADTTSRRLYTVRGELSSGERDSLTVTIDPGDTTVVVLFDAPVPEREAVTDLVAEVYDSNRPSRALQAGNLPSGLRAEGDLATLWQVEGLSETSVNFREFSGAPGLIQHPALSKEYPGHLRFLAYISDESGAWQLYVQPLIVNESQQLVENGARIHVPTPGTLDNLSCERDVFYPRFLSSSTASELEIVVGMADCPGNGFEQLGFDDEPWAIGEYRVWKVRVEIP